MKKTEFLVCFFVCYLFYLFLTAGSGSTLFLWDPYEFLFGAILSLIAAIVVRLTFSRTDFKMLNPKRWFQAIIYIIGPFFYNMVLANIDVAKRVITKDISPGIVRIEPGLKSDRAKTLLANSITLTPGTLTVDIIDDKFYIHWINVKNLEPDLKDVCGPFAIWAKRIAEA